MTQRNKQRDATKENNFVAFFFLLSHQTPFNKSSFLDSALTFCWFAVSDRSRGAVSVCGSVRGSVRGVCGESAPLRAFNLSTSSSSSGGGGGGCASSAVFFLLFQNQRKTNGQSSHSSSSSSSPPPLLPGLAQPLCGGARRRRPLSLSHCTRRKEEMCAHMSGGFRWRRRTGVLLHRRLSLHCKKCQCGDTVLKSPQPHSCF